VSYLAAPFLIFLLILLAVYYMVPGRFRWIALLAASLTFYCWGGRFKAMAYLLCTAFSTWLAALMMDRLSAWTVEYLRLNAALSPDEKKGIKRKAKREKTAVFIFALAANLMVLGVLKYSNFAAEGAIRLYNALTGAQAAAPNFEFLIPLGISFYTLQSLGYLIDIFWGKYGAEKNFAKYLLFVSYFPQIVQGPIGRYDALAAQLTAPNPFRYEKLKRGAVRMLWGYMKKLVIADRLAPLVGTVCKDPLKYDGSVIVMTILFYAVQLYADFSGGIDIVSGASEMFGVRLASNFSRPYFASSLGDFWRRWHISLGAWMRDYVFYSFARSKAVTKLCRALKSRRHIRCAVMFPAAAGNMIVFLLVGLWHGAELRYVMWGLYNGLILALAVILKPAVGRFYRKFPQMKENPLWHGFQIVRTFLIVCLGYYFDCCQGVREALAMMKKSLTDFHLSALGNDAMLGLGMQARDYVIAAAAVLLLAAVSVLQERGMRVRESLDRRCTAVQWSLYYGLIFFVIAFAATGVDATEGFMYALF